MEWRIAILIKQLNNNNNIPAPANPLRTHICEIHPIIWMNAHKIYIYIQKNIICKQKHIHTYKHTHTQIHKYTPHTHFVYMTKYIKWGTLEEKTEINTTIIWNFIWMIFDYAIYSWAQSCINQLQKRYRQLFKQLLISGRDEFGLFSFIVSMYSKWLVWYSMCTH